MRFFSFFTLLLLFPLGLSAQKTIVSGRVTEVNSGSPIAFANIFFKGSTTGTYSDEVGNYILETTESWDTLQVSALGYNDTIILLQPIDNQTVNISLTSSDYVLGEVVVLAGENPAFEILRQVVNNKPQNNPTQYDTYKYKSYNKIQFDLNNFTDKIKKNFLFRPFPFVWQYQDSMANGVRYLPFLFKENIKEHYYKKNPKSYQEYIVAKQTAQFFKGEKIEEFITDMYLDPNVYDNFVVLLDKSFPSPINDNFQRFYKYFLADTLTQIDGLPCHHIRFSPRGKNDVAFTGDIYIHDSTYAVKRVDLNFSSKANVNFVRSFWLRMDYEWINQQHWFNKKSTVLADFTVVENSAELTGFFGRRYSDYQNVELNQPIDDQYFTPVEEVVEKDSAARRSTDFWETQRVESLSAEEKNIFTLVDTIAKNQKFKVIKGIFETFGTGWMPLPKLDIGNIFTFYSWNDVEGSRLKFGARTSSKSEFPLKLEGYLAYGTRDKRFKYFAKTDFIFNKDYGKHNLIGLSYKKDADQIGRSYTTIPIDHFATFLLQIAPFDSRTFLTEKKAYLERQWFKGFVTRITLFQNSVEPFGDYNFLTINDDGTNTPISQFNLSGWKFSSRFAWGEQNLNAKFYDKESVFFLLKYPVVSLEFTAGIKDFLNSDFDYQRLNIRVEHQQRMNRLGYLSYNIEAGKIWGTVPYPFLGIPFGNQAVLADKVSFNMMNYQEFASDEYLAVHLEHHFEGLIFNKIPGVRNLKLRLFLLGRMFAGRLSEKNNAANWAFPERLYAIEEPYFEVGFGIENILKLGRVDLTWRLNYLDHEDTYRFLPKPSFQFRF